MGNLCLCCNRLWQKFTDRYYKIEEVRESDLLQGALVCAYPFCYTINSISLDSNRIYYKYRGKSYCCRNCVNSHRKIGYATLYHDSNSNVQYADL